MTKLITGGAGFVGSNFVHYWLNKYPHERLVVLDALTYAGNLENLQPALECKQFRFVKGSICDVDLVLQLLRQEDVDTIVHFAAESAVDRSIADPDTFIQTNVVGTYSLLKAARQVWLEERKLQQHRFHHVSTDEVFGSLEPLAPGATEESSYVPNSPYSASKAGADHMVRAYYRTYGLQVTISNCSNNYGPHHFPEKLIPLLILNLLEGRHLPIYGDGRNVRDWLHVTDHCQAIELILERGRAGEMYNIGAGNEIENIALATLLCALVDELFTVDADLTRRFPAAAAARGIPSERLIRFVADRPGHDRRYAIDCRKIREQLGYAAQVSLKTGLRSTVRWYVDNEAWWRRVAAGEHRHWIDDYDC